MKALEMFVLVLVVVHAAQHLPKELREARRKIRHWGDRLIGEVNRPVRRRMVVAIITALAVAVTASPVVYYGLECGVRLMGHELRVA